jgi:hypothetical protein
LPDAAVDLAGGSGTAIGVGLSGPESTVIKEKQPIETSSKSAEVNRDLKIIRLTAAESLISISP